MKKTLKTPWKDNPSKPENFYEEPGVFEEFSSDEIVEEKEVIEENLDIEEIINQDKAEEVKESKESDDPYAQILKDLQ